MHSFRLRYVALGLLIYIQSAFSDTCGSDGFVDVASTTVLSSAVFEGQAKKLARLREGRILVLFKVTTVYKGNLTGVGNNNNLHVLVGNFGPSVNRTLCVASTDGLRLNSRTSYLVFLNTTGQPALNVSVDEFEDTQFTNYYSKLNKSNNDASSVSYYGISGFPENATKQNCQEARNYSSLKSAISPRIELNASRRLLKVDQKLQLICKATGGRPPPLVTWFRNGTALMPSKHLVLRKKGKALNLAFHIRKAKAEDAGIYQCLAANIGGSIWSKNVTVELSGGHAVGKLDHNEKPHQKLCTRQNYCLNEGKCFILTSLGKKFCECKSDFEGNRCQEKTIPLAVKMATDNKRRLFKRMHGSHS